MKPTVSHVMTPGVVTVDALAPFKEVVRLMQEHRVSALPVVDTDGVLVGIVSEGDLILKEDPELGGGGHLFESRRHAKDRSKAAGKSAYELMSTPVISVAPDASLGEAARKMHRAEVKRLPVVDAHGHLVGIVSRADLLRVFLREDAEIALEIRDDVIRRTLWIDPDTIRIVVREGVVTMQGQIERRSLLPILERLVASIEGVVAVDDRLSYAVDDTAPGDLPTPWSVLAPRVGGR
jgi:CBS domain-containing protein